MKSCMTVFLFLCFLVGAYAKQTICLNMIVKDESRVIQHCLDSVKSIIDYWVIVDTGSSDGTQEIIQNYLKDIPGELYQRPWKNFGENRSEAFDLAKEKGDYILFMDADDTLQFEGKIELPILTKDLYQMWRGVEGFTYIKPQIVKGNLPWKWVGVTHEYLDCPVFYTMDTLANVKYISGEGGARSLDPNKFLKNVALLEEGLIHEPNNERYVFYLAESYRDAGEKGKALERYQKRINMGGWEEEVFWSMLQIANLLRDIGVSSNIVIKAYDNAHKYRPHRPEPLYFLAELYNRNREYEKAYNCIKLREHLSDFKQKDILFNMDWMDAYGFTLQLSISAYFIEHYQESLDACDKLLKMEQIPQEWLELAKYNRSFALYKLANLDD